MRRYSPQRDRARETHRRGVDVAGNFRLARAARGIAESTHNDAVRFHCSCLGSAYDIFFLGWGVHGPLVEKRDPFAPHPEECGVFIQRSAAAAERAALGSGMIG